MFNVFSGIRTYNVNIAQRLGLEEAIFLQACIEVENSKGEPFRLDTAKMFIDYGIPVEHQSEILDKLVESSIIEKAKGGKINVLSSGLAQLFKESTTETTPVQSVPKPAKADCVAKSLMTHIKSSDENIRKLYADWIESVQKRNGYLTGAMVDLFQSTVESYNNQQLTEAVLKIGIIKGWKDAYWCINYVNQHPEEFVKPAVTSLFNKTQPVPVLRTKVELGGDIF